MIPPRLKYNRGRLSILDQRLIPWSVRYLTVSNYIQAANAIRDMVLRGAPLIGCAAAYAYVLALRNKKISSKKVFLEYINKVEKTVNAARPTAIALFTSSARIRETITKILDSFPEKLDWRHCKTVYEAVLAEAKKIEREDIFSTLAMSRLGSKLLKKNSTVITYCNTGALATMGIGTAVGVITESFKKGKISFVYACETRPYLQGARLTIWELLKNKVPCALITDNMASHIMKTERIDAVIIGADRIASNGDTANKIGSYQLAIAAKYHKIPFYVVAPSTTFDLRLKNGDEIKIEERSEKEVTEIRGVRFAVKGIKVRHPAFDVTPNSLITAIITEIDIIKPVNAVNIRKIIH